MRISLIHPSLKARGGAERVVMRLAGSLAKRGHEVKLLTAGYDADFWGAIDSLPFHVHVMKEGDTKSVTKSTGTCGPVIAKLCRGDDVVNPHNFPATAWVWKAKQLAPNFPRTIWYCEEPPRGHYADLIDENVRKAFPPRPIPPWKWYRHYRRKRKTKKLRALDMEAVSTTDLILANSRCTAANIKTIYGREARVCYLGVNGGNGSMTTEASAGSAAKGAPYFLTVTRLQLLKNVKTLLMAMRLLKERGQIVGWHYRVIGEGDAASELIRLAGQWDLLSVVRFMGFVPDAQLTEEIRRAYFVAYLPLDEPFGLVPLEAAALGVPSLVSDHGGPAETVIHGVTGWQVDPLDAELAARHVYRLMNEPDLCRKAGREARRWVEERFLWEHFIERYLSFIEGRTS